MWPVMMSMFGGSPTTGGIDTGNRQSSNIGYESFEAGTSTAVTGRIRVDAEHDVTVIADKYALGAAGYTSWTGF